jgi:hypothetical protein
MERAFTIQRSAFYVRHSNWDQATFRLHQFLFALDACCCAFLLTWVHDRSDAYDGAARLLLVLLYAASVWAQQSRNAYWDYPSELEHWSWHRIDCLILSLQWIFPVVVFFRWGDGLETVFVGALCNLSHAALAALRLLYYEPFPYQDLSFRRVECAWFLCWCAPHVCSCRLVSGSEDWPDASTVDMKNMTAKRLRDAQENYATVMARHQPDEDAMLIKLEP